MKIEKKWPTVKVMFQCDGEGCTKTGESPVRVDDAGRLAVVNAAPAGWGNPYGSSPRLCPSCAKGGASLDGIG